MSNHLARETSPYLLQHADNPVDWYLWGQEALAMARSQNKPIITFHHWVIPLATGAM